MGMSLEKVESSDRGIFVKFARSLLRDGKTQIPSGSIPCIGVFRAIFRAWQRWRFHKRVEEITETQRGKNITNFLSQTTHFNFLFPILYFFPYLSANLPLFPRDKSYFSPCFINTPFLSSFTFVPFDYSSALLLYRCIKRNWGEEGLFRLQGRRRVYPDKTRIERIILLKFCLRLSLSRF